MAFTSGCWPASRHHASPRGLCGKQEAGGGAEGAGLQVCLWPLFISKGDTLRLRTTARPHPTTSMDTKL